jgi:hypothetical protein
MRILFLVFFFLACITTLQAQQIPGGYEIKVTTDYKNVQMYLGNYYGKRKLLADSAMADNKGIAIFKGEKKLPQGIYFIVSPQHVILFELLMDKPQHFTIIYDSTKPGDIKFSGSPDNDVFTAYSSFLAKMSPRLNGLQQQLKTAGNAADSATIGKELSKASAELTDYRNSVIMQSPNSILAALLQVARVPDRPQMPKLANGTVDSLYPFYYVKEHYWDNVDFNNDMILRTPFFEPKLEDFLQVLYISQS